MKKYLLALLSAVLLLNPVTSNAVFPDKSSSYEDGGVVLRFAGSEGAIVNPGEELGFSFQTGQNSYVVVFNIDTEGFVHLLYPAPGGSHTPSTARRWYSIPEDRYERFLAEGETGIEFVFALTVPDRAFIDQEELEFLAKNESLSRDLSYRIDGDPFLAANIIAGELVRGISHRAGVFLDYTYFYLNERVSYPCYLCGECDGDQSDPLCGDFEITANFDRRSPLTYPLPRAYEFIEPSSGSAEDYDVASDEEYDKTYETSRVHVTFYPYKSEVYYDVYHYDRDLDFYLYVWDPWWYDPWTCGWHYYPSYGYGWNWWRYPYGHYFTWTFNWGWWGGYYCSPWFYPRYHRLYDYYYHDYYRDYWRWDRYDRYKDRYKPAYERSPYKVKYSTLASAHKLNARRDSRLKIAAGDLRRTSEKGKYVSNARAKNIPKSTKLRTGKDRGAYQKYNKTTRIKNLRPGDTRAKTRLLDRNRSTKSSNKSAVGKNPNTRKRDTNVKKRTSGTDKGKQRSYNGTKPRAKSSTKSGTVKKKSSKQRSSGSKKSSVQKNNSPSRSKSSKSNYKSSGGSRRSSSSSPAVKSPSRSSTKSSAGSRSSSSSRSGGGSKSGGKSKRK